jgi:hypothetical protein
MASASQGPEAERQTVEALFLVLAGHVRAVPSQTALFSHGPLDALHSVPAVFAPPATHPPLPSHTESSWHGLAAAPQGVPAVAKLSLGQLPLLHVSAGSQMGCVEDRHSTVSALAVAVGQL